MAEGLLSFVPVAILGAAIGWPASLRQPMLAASHAGAAGDPVIRMQVRRSFRWL